MIRSGIRGALAMILILLCSCSSSQALPPDAIVGSYGDHRR